MPRYEPPYKKVWFIDRVRYDGLLDFIENVSIEFGDFEFKFDSKVKEVDLVQDGEDGEYCNGDIILGELSEFGGVKYYKNYYGSEENVFETEELAKRNELANLLDDTCKVMEELNICQMNVVKMYSQIGSLINYDLG